MNAKNDLPAEARWLIPQLSDPFIMFPLQSVARKLGSLLAESDDDLVAAPPARKYWDVKHEHAQEMSGLLLGTAFVLGQVALTQTTSILCRLRSLTGHLSSLPKRREAMLDLDAPVDTESSLSVLVIVDTAANYFKHHHEWPTNWTETDETPQQRKTIEKALRMGMRPRPSSLTDNLHRALRSTGAGRPDVNHIAAIIQDWRERLTVKVCRTLDLPVPDELEQLDASDQGGR